jgi:hypothetical protein
MVEDEANQLIGFTVPYWSDPGADWGDTKAEENAWRSMLLQLATSMMPGHENYMQWMEKNIELMISAYSRPGDSNNFEVLHGKPVKEWLHGYNINQDGTLINRNILHPDYMITIKNLAFAGIAYSLAGQPTPKAAFFNLPVVYHALTDLQFDQQIYAAPGGTIYIPDTGYLYYPRGPTDGDRRIMHAAHLDVLADAFGFDSLSSRKGAYWEDVHARYVLAMQQRGTDGRCYQDYSESTSPTREEWFSDHAGRAYLAKWIKSQGVFALTNKDYNIAVEKVFPVSAASVLELWPNPFSDRLRISIILVRQGGGCRLSVYDLTGRKITTLPDARLAGAHYTVEWNGVGSDGKIAANGCYVVCMETKDITLNRKVLFVRH